MITPTDQLKKSLWKWVRKHDISVSQEQIEELSDLLYIFVDGIIESRLSQQSDSLIMEMLYGQLD